MAKNFTVMLYHIPEDLDDPEQPNAYGIPLKQEDIKLKDIKNSFPIEGEYVLRFKYKLANQIVWMDILDDEQKPPLFNSRIIFKATRLSDKSVKKQSSQQISPAPSQTFLQQQQVEENNRNQNNLLDF